MPSKDKPCPKCGKPMDARAKFCRKCIDWSAVSKIPTPTDYKIMRVCRKCGNEFRITHSRQYTCDGCRTRTCPVCGNSFKLVSYNNATVTCSMECSLIWNTAPMLHCEWCGKEFKQRQGRRMKYCSQKCRYEAAIKYNQDGRRSYKAKQWRVAVMERDHYRCQHCGALEQLQAHHILEWKNHSGLRFDVSNGITLCQSCHSKEHGGMIIPRAVARMPICSVCGRQTKGHSDKCRSCAMKAVLKAGSVPA